MPAHTVRRLMAIGAMVLLLGAGLCLIDSHRDDGTGVDLCFSMLALVSAPLPLLLGASGLRVAPARGVRGSSAFFEPLAPPPRV